LPWRRYVVRSFLVALFFSCALFQLRSFSVAQFL
jgi:hypothetical protein